MFFWFQRLVRAVRLEGAPVEKISSFKLFEAPVMLLSGAESGCQQMLICLHRNKSELSRSSLESQSSFSNVAPAEVENPSKQSPLCSCIHGLCVGFPDLFPAC